mgnify:CR=1 FL=1
MAEQGQPDMEPDMQPQLNGSVAEETGSSLEAVRRKGEGAYGCKHYRWVGCLIATMRKACPSEPCCAIGKDAL